MSDIFISYKREDQPIARKLADALERRGWSVWWDPKLRAGERFDDVIEKALNESKCVLVMWSKRSVQSSYVRDEATYALDRGKLVPVAIEETDLPFRFKGLHTPNLVNWDGSSDSAKFGRLVRDITEAIGKASVPAIDLELSRTEKVNNRVLTSLEANLKAERNHQPIKNRLAYGLAVLGILVISATLWQLLDRFEKIRDKTQIVKDEQDLPEEVDSAKPVEGPSQKTIPNKKAIPIEAGQLESQRVSRIPQQQPPVRSATGPSAMGDGKPDNVTPVPSLPSQPQHVTPLPAPDDRLAKSAPVSVIPQDRVKAVQAVERMRTAIREVIQSKETITFLITHPTDEQEYLVFISNLLSSACRQTGPRQCWFTQEGPPRDLDRPPVRKSNKPGIVVHGPDARALAHVLGNWFETYSASDLPPEMNGYKEPSTSHFMWIDIGPGSPWKQ